MGKIVFWIVVIIAGLFVARLLARQATKQNQPRVPPMAPSKNKAATPEAMVRCAHCGIHMPRSEALLLNGKTWCTKEHAKLGIRE